MEQTGTPRIKEWKTGYADEIWKVIVCAQDITRADNTLSSLVYILVKDTYDVVQGAEELKKMSGKDIIEGLEAYRKSAHETIEKGLEKK